jgi:glycosyltransferase involved in cell wall biosynthesis
MAGASGGPVRTFTAGYGPKDASFNETAKARRLADLFGAGHSETILRPDIRSVMEKLAAQFDEPFADASAIPTYLITKEARKAVKVALTGIGGDELLGGYPRHLGARFLQRYLKAPRFFREGVWSGARFLPESLASKNIPGRVKRFLRGGRLDFRKGYESWISYFSREDKKRLYAGALLPAQALPDFDLPGRLEDPDDIFAFEVRNYLSDDLLCLADRTSMANSLELRVPFLDTRLAEFMSGAPMALKTRGFGLKYLLKKAMAGRLPPDIINSGKMGFQVPLARWYTDELKAFAHEILSPSALRETGYLAPEYLALMLKEHESGRRNLGDQLYAAMMFELWLRGSAVTPEAPSAPEVLSVRRPLTAVICTDIIQDDYEGGSGRVAWQLACGLAKRGHKIIVLTKGVDSRKDFEMVEGVEVYSYRGSPVRLFAAAREILKKHGKPDVLELHHPYTAFLALRAFRGVPAVYNFHSPWAEEYAIKSGALGFSAVRRAAGGISRRWIEHSALKASKAVLNASHFMAERLKTIHDLESLIIPLGVDLEKFCPAGDPMRIRQHLQIPENRFVIFTVRNLVARMGLENLVSAAKIVAAARPDALFIIGGRGYLKEKLEKQIALEGLEGVIRLEGYISEKALPGYYQAADLFVLPTRLLEGFGLVTLEALACGTPALATPVGANAEVLGDFGSEFLLDGCGPGDIAEGILKFIRKDVAARAGLRERCRRRVERDFSWDKYAAEVEKVLYAVQSRPDGK